jgi:hypothetical protein
LEWYLIVKQASFSFFETRFVENFGQKVQGSFSLVDTFYFIVITFSTVGYGDLGPKTDAGKLVICVLIFAGVALLPAMVSDLIGAIVENSGGGGIFYPNGSEYMVIAGEFWNGNRVVEMIDSLIRKVTMY